MNQLILALVDKKVINSDNVITASYTVCDSAGRSIRKVGNFGVIKIDKLDDSVNFTLQHVLEKKRVKVDDESIIAIDGMDPRRYADVYDINADGSNKKTGKKRGRKPKSA